MDRTDAFVAVTGDDRANLLAAMYARQLGARMTIAGISRGEFAPLADALGVDLTISPRMLAAEAILRFVRKGEVIDVALLASGAEMIELRVHERCRVAGRPLSEVGFPKAPSWGLCAMGQLSSRRARKFSGQATTPWCSPSRMPWKRSRTSSPPSL